MTHQDTPAARLARIATASTTCEGVTRLPWTGEHRAALGQITEWMEDAGLQVTLDAAGTLCGRSPNPGGKPVLMIGSHQDSVPSGGAFDGIMGVALGCLAAKALRDELARFPFAIEVLAFADEEGVRFPTALIGPRALAGTLDPAALDMRDGTGQRMRDAMTAFGVEPAGIGALGRDPASVAGYLEAHIEQGPVLERHDLPVAAVSAICGIARHEVTIRGETGHAGTVPMAGRRDALVESFGRAGWTIPSPSASMFAWAPIPEPFRALGSLEFSKLLIEKADVAVAPGIGFGEHGDEYVRIALVENEQRIRQAGRNVRRFLESADKTLHNVVALKAAR